MPRVIPATARVDKALRQFSKDRAQGLADCVISPSGSESIDRGRLEKVLDEAGPECDAYEVRWTRWPINMSDRDPGRADRLYFFAGSEKEVLDRLTVAEVLLL